MTRSNWVRRLLAAVIAGLLVGVGLAAYGVWWVQERPLPLRPAAAGAGAGEAIEVSVEPGDSPRAVARAWVSAGVQAPEWALYEWFRWSGQARRIRAGSYAIEAGTTPAALLRKMVEGDENLLSVRLIEGWTLRQFRAELARTPGLKPSTAVLSEAELLALLGAAGTAGEGAFFPDTYAFSRGTSDLAVLQRAHRQMQRELDQAWAARAPDSPLRNPQELLVLASIVEKETGRAEDRALVAGVFVNRLRIGMLLQTDPTVIYGLGDAFDGNLRRIHLTTDTPYNTYTRAGLPPTPIAMPGRASLKAAGRPAPTRALYFVARGDGSSEFSETLADHNRAVNRYQRGR